MLNLICCGPQQWKRCRALIVRVGSRPCCIHRVGGFSNVKKKSGRATAQMPQRCAASGHHRCRSGKCPWVGFFSFSLHGWPPQTYNHKNTTFPVGGCRVRGAVRTSSGWPIGPTTVTNGSTVTAPDFFLRRVKRDVQKKLSLGLARTVRRDIMWAGYSPPRSMRRSAARRSVWTAGAAGTVPSACVSA